MGYEDLVRSGVALANRLTASLQVPVKHSAWVSQGAYGTPVYATAVSRPALVEFKQAMRRMLNGSEVMQVATITFLEPVPANGAAGRREPIDPRDKIVLPNGYAGPIIGVEGMVDPDTDAPYLLTVTMG